MKVGRRWNRYGQLSGSTSSRHPSWGCGGSLPKEAARKVSFAEICKQLDRGKGTHSFAIGTVNQDIISLLCGPVLFLRLKNNVLKGGTEVCVGRYRQALPPVQRFEQHAAKRSSPLHEPECKVCPPPASGLGREWLGGFFYS